jgi:hypothetical protein
MAARPPAFVHGRLPFAMWGGPARAIFLPRTRMTISARCTITALRVAYAVA